MNYEQKIKDLNLTLPKAADPVGSYLATKKSRKFTLYFWSDFN